MNLRLLLACSTALLAGCATAPIAEDKLPALAGDQGIAGISFESTFEVSDVEFISMSGQGGMLHVSFVPIGQSVFLYVVPAGKYCISEYSFRGHYFKPNIHDQCFEVETGKLSYSGTFTPTMPLVDQVVGGDGMHGGMSQRDNPRAFFNALSLQYPNIAKQAFPSGSDRSVGELAPPPETPAPTGICDLMSTGQANELLGKEVRPGVEFHLGNLVTCNYVRSNDETVNVQFQFCNDPDQDLVDNFGKETLRTGGVLRPAQGLPGKAGIASKGHNYELDVALPDRMMVLVVDGTKRDDIIQAMITAMQRMLPSARSMPPTRSCS